MKTKRPLFLALALFCFITQPAVASEEDFYIEELDAGFRSDLSVQKVFQLDGLKGVTIMADAEVKLMKSPGNCHQFPLIGEKDAAISIIANSQQLNELDISFEHGYFRVEALEASRDAILQIRIYVDDLESIEMGQRAGQKLTINLNQNGRTQLGYISASDVQINMNGHGSLVVGEVRSEGLHLNLEGHGKLTFSQVTTQIMDVTMNGHGEIDLNGSAYTQHVSLFGHGNYNAANLDSVHAALYVRGQARSDLRVSNDLELDVNHPDNIRYSGSPLITNTQEALLVTSL